MLTAQRLRDLLDYDPASGLFRWRVKVRPQTIIGEIAGTPHLQGYWKIRVDGGTYLAHRLAWLYVNGEWPPGLIDHRNTNRRDNSFDNLRLADKSKNAANSHGHRDAASGIKGVYWSKAHKGYRAAVCVRGKRRFSPAFATAEEAAAIYRQWSHEGFGDFARVE